MEERASCGQQALHRAGPCMGRDSGSSHPANTSLRGLVSEPGPSGGEAGKEGWLKVNNQDEAEERIMGKGTIDGWIVSFLRSIGSRSHSALYFQQGQPPGHTEED